MKKLSILFTICSVVTIAGIGIFQFLRIEQIHKNEESAIGSLKTFAAQETDYNNNSNPHTYSDDMQLLQDIGRLFGVGPTYIDPDLSSGNKDGYCFTLEAACSRGDGSFWCWSAGAWPVVYRKTGVRSFYVDDSGTVRAADCNGKLANVALPAIDQ